MSKKELSTVINGIKELKASLSGRDKKFEELCILVQDVSKKLDAILNTAGSKKPVTTKKTKSTAVKSLDERKCFNVIVFFKHFYPLDEKKFDSLWKEGEKKKILDAHSKEWEGKTGAEKTKIQTIVLYKNLSKEARSELRVLKKAAQDEFKMNAKKMEDHAEEDVSDTEKE